ncbi:MAG: hypothetical protein QM737_15910 [Ferruginibacter sp.]
MFRNEDPTTFEFYDDKISQNIVILENYYRKLHGMELEANNMISKIDETLKQIAITRNKASIKLSYNPQKCKKVTGDGLRFKEKYCCGIDYVTDSLFKHYTIMALGRFDQSNNKFEVAEESLFMSMKLWAESYGHAALLYQRISTEMGFNPTSYLDISNTIPERFYNDNLSAYDIDFIRLEES